VGKHVIEGHSLKCHWYTNFLLLATESRINTAVVAVQEELPIYSQIIKIIGCNLIYTVSKFAFAHLWTLYQLCIFKLNVALIPPIVISYHQLIS
jgi:hypothetical protein